MLNVGAARPAKCALDWRRVLLLTLLVLLNTTNGHADIGDAEVADGRRVKTRAPTLQLREGRVSGKVLTSEGGRQYFAYLGIPYAKPPVGDLRFKVRAT